MHALDLRETSLVRSALGADGSSEALDLLGLLPATGAATDGLSSRQADLAARALDAFARRHVAFGYLAIGLASELRGGPARRGA